MDKRLASHVEMALLTPDAIEAWNTVINARHLLVTLSYMTPVPTLFLTVPGAHAEPWLLVDTRRHRVVETVQNAPELNLARQDMQDRMAKLGLRITLKYKVDKQKRKRVILALQSNSGGPMFTAMHVVPKGSKAEYSDFKLTDRWN